jgi:dolichyl-phosphate beta-glucosyltransferase
MGISIVIPAYNEEKRIGSTLSNISEYMRSRKDDYEILVVDDGSKDNTKSVVFDHMKKDKKIKYIANPGNKGKGYAVRNGMLNSTMDFVLFSDADLSTPIEELGRFLQYTDEFDVIIASRNMKESNVVKQPIHRRLPGKIFPLFVNLLAVRGIKDTQCGFKLFSRDAANKIDHLQHLHGFAFDVEVLFIARKLGYKIKYKYLL